MPINQCIPNLLQIPKLQYAADEKHAKGDEDEVRQGSSCQLGKVDSVPAKLPQVILNTLPQQPPHNRPYILSHILALQRQRQCRLDKARL